MTDVRESECVKETDIEGENAHSGAEQANMRISDKLSLHSGARQANTNLNTKVSLHTVQKNIIFNLAQWCRGSN